MKKFLLSLFFAFCFCAITANAAKKGDVNGNGTIDVSDVTALINAILSTGGDPACDVNGNGTIDVSDVTALINIILNGEPEQHEYVDLKLDSGTLWATCNVGASRPEEYGLYFAYGETKGYAKGEKHTFDWAHYKWMTPGRADEYGVNKYTLEDGKTDGCWYSGGVYVGTTVDGVTYKDLSNLLPEDDAATVNWGDEWCMPDKYQEWELFSEFQTRQEVTSINGVVGMKLISRRNGKSIFFPYAGFRVDDELQEEGECGYYRTTSLLQETLYSEFLCMNLSGSGGTGSWHTRCEGYTIRPVRKKK